MKSSIYLLLLLFFGSTAQALQELGPIEKLPAMSGPDSRAIGWEWHFIDQDNKPGYMRKVAGDGKFASYTRTDGCEWSRSTQGFAPAFKWRNCPSSGTSRVEHLDGDIWPLDLGKTLSYRVTGTSSLLGRAWSSKRECAVVAAVRIKIVSGNYDTFKVECKERWGLRTWWLSPKVGTAVAYQQTTRRGDFILQEMTKIVIP